MHVDFIANELGKVGIGMTKPLGFNNTYALVMQRERANKLGIRTISDLQKHPELKFGFTHEFLDRQDGWSPLAVAYRLRPQNVVGIDHALGYAALVNGSIDVKDAYSTDAKIAEYDLLVLEVEVLGPFLGMDDLASENLDTFEFRCVAFAIAVVARVHEEEVASEADDFACVLAPDFERP